eukprot:403353046
MNSSAPVNNANQSDLDQGIIGSETTVDAIRSAKQFTHQPNTKRPSRFFYESMKIGQKPLTGTSQGFGIISNYQNESLKSQQIEDDEGNLEEEDSGSEDSDNSEDKKANSNTSSSLMVTDKFPQQASMDVPQQTLINDKTQQSQFEEHEGTLDDKKITRVIDKNDQQLPSTSLSAYILPRMEDSKINSNHSSRDSVDANQNTNHQSGANNRKLKKKLSPQSKMGQFKEQYKKRKSIAIENIKMHDDSGMVKKTVILSLDDCLLKTSIFKHDLPRVDGEFIYNNLNIFVCYRPYMEEFLETMKESFELILWSSSQSDYTEKLLQILEPPGTQKKFQHYLDLSHCQRSEDDSFMIKNIDILLENRSKDDIILVDTNMHNYTVHLTNGIMIPAYHVDKDSQDHWLLDLSKYLKEFKDQKSVRQKIKIDFQLDQIFEESKQNQAFKKIKTSHESLMQEIQQEKSIDNPLNYQSSLLNDDL